MRLHRVEAKLVVGFLGLLPAAALHPLQPVLAEELGWMRCPDGSVPAREDIRSAVLRASPANPLGVLWVQGKLDQCIRSSVPVPAAYTLCFCS